MPVYLQVGNHGKTSDLLVAQYAQEGGEGVLADKGYRGICNGTQIATSPTEISARETCEHHFGANKQQESTIMSRRWRSQDKLAHSMQVLAMNIVSTWLAYERGSGRQLTPLPHQNSFGRRMVASQ